MAKVQDEVFAKSDYILADEQQQTGPLTKGQVIIIGAGAGGLSTAYALKRSGISATIVERSDKVGSSWRNRHPQLQLNTVRTLSHLPGLSLPANAGDFPARDTLIQYLEDYVQFIDVPIDYGVEVKQIQKTIKGWCVSTSKGDYEAPHLVVASGQDRVPYIPDWPGKSSYRGKILHSANFGDLRQYIDKRVLVVGAGNSGSDILNHLATINTKSVDISVRYGPTISPERKFGIPIQRLAPFLERLPAWAIDKFMAFSEKLTYGDLTKYGFQKHPLGGASRIQQQGITPAVDKGFVAALKAGRMEVVAEIKSFDETGVILMNGKRLEPEFVVCATGYNTGLENLFGPLAVLNETGLPLINGAESMEQAPGLRFIGMRPSLSGNFYSACRDSVLIAEAILSETELSSASGHCRGKNV